MRAEWRCRRLYRAACSDQPGLNPVQVAHQCAGESQRIDSFGLVIVSNLAVAGRVAEHPHRAGELRPGAIVAITVPPRVSQRTTLPNALFVGSTRYSSSPRRIPRDCRVPAVVAERDRKGSPPNSLSPITRFTGLQRSKHSRRSYQLVRVRCLRATQ
jgi:hypothetical protein